MGTSWRPIVENLSQHYTHKYFATKHKTHSWRPRTQMCSSGLVRRFYICCFQLSQSSHIYIHFSARKNEKVCGKFASTAYVTIWLWLGCVLVRRTPEWLAACNSVTLLLYSKAPHIYIYSQKSKVAATRSLECNDVHISHAAGRCLPPETDYAYAMNMRTKCRVYAGIGGGNVCENKCMIWVKKNRQIELTMKG